MMFSNDKPCAPDQDVHSRASESSRPRGAEWQKTDSWLCHPGQCTGCMACADVCEVHAIEPRVVEGFYYPLIDERKCVNCGRCRRACPVIQPDATAQTGFEQSDCYLAWAHDDRIRLAGSSGGIFGLLARQTLDKGGIVCGAAFDSDMKLRHTLIEQPADLNPLLRSKYVQSDLTGVHRRLREQLEQGRHVLLCGTPCQTAALKQVTAGKFSGQLTLLNFACHGVPSPVIFSRYIGWLEERYADKIVDFVFRNKLYGWSCGLYALVRFRLKGERVVKFSENFFFRCFIECHLIRDSCAACPFRKYPAGADITLADFWGIQRFINLKSQRERFKGFSGLLVHSDTGRRLLTSLEGGIHLIPMARDKLLSNNSFKDHTRGMRAAEFLERERVDPAYSYFRSWPPISRRDRAEIAGRMLLRSWFFPSTRLIARVLYGKKVFSRS